MEQQEVGHGLLVRSVRDRNTNFWHLFFIVQGLDRVFNVGIYFTEERATEAMEVIRKVVPNLTEDKIANRSYATEAGMFYDLLPEPFPEEVNKRLLEQAKEQW